MFHWIALYLCQLFEKVVRTFARLTVLVSKFWKHSWILNRLNEHFSDATSFTNDWNLLFIIWLWSKKHSFKTFHLYLVVFVICDVNVLLGFICTCFNLVFHWTNSIIIFYINTYIITVSSLYHIITVSSLCYIITVHIITVHIITVSSLISSLYVITWWHTVMTSSVTSSLYHHWRHHLVMISSLYHHCIITVYHGKPYHRTQFLV